MVHASPIFTGLLLIAYGCQGAPTSSTDASHNARHAIMRKQGKKEDEGTHRDPSFLTLGSHHDVRPQLKRAKTRHRAHRHQQVTDDNSVCQKDWDLARCNQLAKCRWFGSTGECHENHVLRGFCDNWQEGSTSRINGEGASFWQNHADDGEESHGQSLLEKGGGEEMRTQEDCWLKCTSEPACRQAVFKRNNSGQSTYCWIGINTMSIYTDSPKKGPHCSGDCEEFCFAKDGWYPDEYGSNRAVLTADVLDERVKDGWCADWIQGGGQCGDPLQCQIDQRDECPSCYQDVDDDQCPPELGCSHWGPEFDLSERGCWEKCEANPTCTQAVYRDFFQKYSCWIGTGMMTKHPVASAMADKCYTKTNFDFNVGVNTMGNGTKDDDADTAGTIECSDTDGTGVSDQYPCKCGTQYCPENTYCLNLHNGESTRCNLAECKNTDKSDVEHVYPCACAQSVCTGINETAVCEAAISTCHVLEECSEKSGNATSSAYPCKCGTKSCVQGTHCKIASGDITLDECVDATQQQTSSNAQDNDTANGTANGTENTTGGDSPTAAPTAAPTSAPTAAPTPVPT